MMEILGLLISYLLGSIPTAVIVTKLLKGDDIRSMGSGNAGGTNVARSVGKKAGVFVGLVDVAKGSVAVILMREFFNPTHNEIFISAAGFFAILGHVYPIFAKFKGGKGVATFAGALIAIKPVFALFMLSAFIPILIISKIVSISSMGSSLLIAPISFLAESMFWIEPVEIGTYGFPIVCSLLIIFTHRTNILRLMKGEESKSPFQKK